MNDLGIIIEHYKSNKGKLKYKRPLGEHIVFDLGDKIFKIPNYYPRHFNRDRLGKYNYYSNILQTELGEWIKFPITKVHTLSISNKNHIYILEQEKIDLGGALNGNQIRNNEELRRLIKSTFNCAMTLANKTGCFPDLMGSEMIFQQNALHNLFYTNGQLMMVDTGGMLDSNSKFFAHKMISKVAIPAQIHYIKKMISL